MSIWKRVIGSWGAVLVLCVGVAQAAPKVIKASLKTVHDREAYSPSHGDVYLRYSNGKQVRMTKSGMCDAPKVASDGRTYGWIEGSRTNWFDPTTGKTHRIFVPAHIVIFSGGRRWCVVTPTAYGRVRSTETCDFDWRFQRGARQIVVSSQASHGPTYYQLFDVRTGKLLAAAEVGLEKKPSWAKGLAGQE